MRGCRHDKPGALVPRHRCGVSGRATAHHFTCMSWMECGTCGAWLPLGEANDWAAHVRIEVRAAEIAAALHEAEVPEMAECEQHGREAHANGMDKIMCVVMCVVRDYESGYLARAIQEET